MDAKIIDPLVCDIIMQNEIERVSPKLEAFRKPKRIKIARGGRGAGAKSWGFASLNVQDLNYKPLQLACLREVQLTLEESVWKLIRETIERLRYPGWIITKEYIDHPATGSHIIFRGISDLRADQIKSLEGFDRFWIEEAQGVSDHSLDVVVPTLRKPGSELWASLNPDEEIDPIIRRFQGRDDCLIVDLEPGPKDNPWWTPELQKEMEEDFKRDPDLAAHVWNGLPRVQGTRSVISRQKIREAMDRDLPDIGGVHELGVDVARFGDDRSVIYERSGLKVVNQKIMNGADTQLVARTAWDMSGRDTTAVFKVDDSGVGGGVTDKLRDLGAKVVAVNNGGKPSDEKLFTTCADEQWFTLPIDIIDIPDDPELMQELSGRQYRYTPDDRRKVESKDDFKKRYGRSPDKADALHLCFYRGNSAPADPRVGAAVAARRSRS